MKLKSNISFIVTAAAAFSVLFGTPVFAAGYGYLNDSGVNARSSASMNGSVTGSLAKGTEVFVSASEGDWLKVTYDDKNSYVARIYVDITRADAVSTGSGVNVRSGAGTNAPVVKQLAKGEPVTVTGVSGSWYQILNGSENAYVSKEFISGDLLSLIVKVNADNVEYSNAKESAYGIVKSETGLNLRGDASTDSKVLEVMAYNDTVDIIENNGEWLKVKSWLGNTGYVKAEFITVKTGVKPENAASSRAAQVIWEPHMFTEAQT